MKRKLLSIFACINIFINCSFNEKTDSETETGTGTESESGSETGTDTDSETANLKLSTYESEVFDLINDHRLKNGLEALVYSSVIQKEAEDHSTNMAEGLSEFGHDGFNTRSQNIRSKLGGIRSSAENVAYGAYPAEDVVEGWLNSSGHRQNIEGNYNIAGLSAKQDANGRWFYTQIFANK